MNEITLDSFNETLDELVKANPHAKNKGDNFKKWCLDNFNIDARISYIKSQQQITNRVSEQFRYFAPFVVFVCSKDVKIETVTKYILERIYAKLQCVALIVVNTLPKENVQDKALIYCFETLFIFKHSDLSKWALQYFCQIKEGSTLLKKTLSSYDDSQFDGGITPVIYYGPPGTGKTHKLQDEYNKYPKENRYLVTFHQSYSYEEFIMGLKAETKSDSDKGSQEITYKYEPGIFYQACEQAVKLVGYASLSECVNAPATERAEKIAKALEDHDKQVIFCIDEINRANISAVFGDLISLIEEDKRLGAPNEMIVELPYTKEKFGVPANLRIIGTMNTADRSIQILDTALRRRFRFKELLPDYNNIDNETAKNILIAINSRIRALLNKDHQIGHSYFMNISGPDYNIQILQALRYKIIPLLQEYFYDDNDKIRFVLGEGEEVKQDSEFKAFFIEDKEATKALHKFEPEKDEEILYKLNETEIDSASKDDSKAESFIKHIFVE